MPLEQREAGQVSSNHHYRASGHHNQLACWFAADGQQTRVGIVGVGAGVGVDVAGAGVAEASTSKQEWWDLDGPRT